MGVPSIVGPGQSGVPQPQILVRKGVDNAIRWTAGERLDHLFEQRCDLFTGRGKDQAVVTDDLALSFRELDNLANQVARYLLDQGITSATGSACCSTGPSTATWRCWRCSRSCRLCAARRRLPDRAGALHPAGRRRQVGGVAVGLSGKKKRIPFPSFLFIFFFFFFFSRSAI